MNYVFATTIRDALSELNKSEGSARIIAGGTDLILDMEAGKRTAATLVDITRIPELRKIEINGKFLEIGSAVTLTEIEQCPEVRKYFPSLAKACATVGSRLIQNTATLTGNVVSAQPAADAGMALSVLDPVFIVESEEGTKELGVDDLYASFGKSAVDSSRELLTKIRIPLPKSNEAASFQRLELRKSLSLPMLNAAAMVCVEQGKFKWLRVRMAPVGVGPVRAEATEKWLKGREATKETIASGAELSLENAKPRSNPLRGSREYREMTLPVIVRRAIEEATAQLVSLEK